MKMKKFKDLKMNKILLLTLTGFIVGCGGGDTIGSDDNQKNPSISSPLNSATNREEYSLLYENIFKDVATSPLSTLSIDVDTASYSNIRRYLTVNNKLPPKDAVRTEEMLNYFNYQYREPNSTEPFFINKSVGETLWNSKTKIIHIGLQTQKVDFSKLPASNLVFLVDVSGSMSSEKKLPLLKKSIQLLVEQLREKDRVSIVVYSGSAGLILDKEKGSEKKKILDALNELSAGGTTAGGEGIELAYKTALEAFIHGGNNRVILATDGDFNIGKSSQRELETLIEEKRDDGVFLTVLGFGMGNFKDNKVETLADKGNGNYAYIDSLLEAKKVLVTEMGSTLYTVAKDVKIQVEFNPKNISAYRLIGYENRKLENEEFNDDKKDAGEIGMGHSVTILYEIKPKDANKSVDNLLFQESVNTGSKEALVNIKVRYKEPNSNASKLISNILTISDKDISKEDFNFAQTVTGFSMILRDSQYKKSLTFKKLIEVAQKSKGQDKEAYREEFIGLIKRADSLSKK
jgi:Ca-activated chloride channel family protein